MKFPREFKLGVKPDVYTLGPGEVEVEERSVERWIKRGCEIVVKHKNEDVSLDEIQDSLVDAENHIDEVIEAEENLLEESPESVDDIEEKKEDEEKEAPKSKRGRPSKKKK